MHATITMTNSRYSLHRQRVLLGESRGLDKEPPVLVEWKDAAHHAHRLFPFATGILSLWLDTSISIGRVLRARRTVILPWRAARVGVPPYAPPTREPTDVPPSSRSAPIFVFDEGVCGAWQLQARAAFFELLGV